MRNQIAHLYNAVLAPVVATPYAPAKKFQRVRKTVSLLYNRIIDKIEYGRETLKNIVKRQGKRRRTDSRQNRLIATEIERASNEAYSRRFVLCGLRKAGINGYVNQVKPHISKC